MKGLDWNRVAMAAGVGLVLILVFAAWFVLAGSHDSQPATERRTHFPERSKGSTIVFVIPGTYGNAAQWPLVIDGKATFASELRRGIEEVNGEGSCSVYAEVWPSSIFNDKREVAARRIAETIDSASREFDRVCIVAHSHGGNVGLLAAGLCRRHIDMVVCLATPHVHLRTRDEAGGELYLPVYCSPATLANTNTIITARCKNDWIPDFWSNSLITGLDETEAVRLTQEWREMKNYPRLADDSFLHRLFESSNIYASNKLSATSYHCELHCLIEDAFRIKPHNFIHNRQIGYAVGKLMSSPDEAAAVDVFGDTLIVKESDAGEPVDAKSHEQWRQTRQVYGQLAGWLLTQVEYEIHESLREQFDDLDGSLPDPCVKVYSANRSELWGVTECATNQLAGQLGADVFVYAGAEAELQFVDQELLGNSGSLIGSRVIELTDPPPTMIAGEGWRLKLQWNALHY